MMSPPAELDPVRLENTLRTGWSLRPAEMEYVPKGAGSYHWRATDEQGRLHFVTVDDLDDKDWIADTRAAAFAGLGQALRTAVTLREAAALDFVVAPIPAADGSPLCRVDDRYAVAVYPFLAGRSGEFGQPNQTDALEMIVAMHRATPIARTGARISAPFFEGRDDLAAFLLDPATRWQDGPFAASAHRLLAPHARQLGELVEQFDRLVELTAATHADPVITHGEPHSGNLMSVDDRLLLVDWDTAGLAAPERDVCLLTADDTPRYEHLTGRRIDPAAIRLYQLRWCLDDLACAVRMFRRPHGETADTRKWHDEVPEMLEQIPIFLAEPR
ncbi:MAG TPA: phosphotransferase [Jatrophihabitans sp.]|jgi:spectinomycin phosphotransferase|nr:phosphotransferase [Jatrophihabitans sp.]